jgi:hypothetical protein
VKITHRQLRRLIKEALDITDQESGETLRFGEDDFAVGTEEDYASIKDELGLYEIDPEFAQDDEAANAAGLGSHDFKALLDRLAAEGEEEGTDPSTGLPGAANYDLEDQPHTEEDIWAQFHAEESAEREKEAAALESLRQDARDSGMDYAQDNRGQNIADVARDLVRGLQHSEHWAAALRGIKRTQVSGFDYSTPDELLLDILADEATMI